MASLRQQIGAWFLNEENKKYQSANLSETLLKEGHKKAMKDLKSNASAMDLKWFRGMWKAYLRGAFKAKSHIAKVAKDVIAVSDIKLNVWTPGDENFDESLFETYKTGCGIDILMSNKGGAAKGSTTIIIGEPGVGKTTVCAHIQKSIQKNYPKAKIACVQSEMKRFDIAYEYKQNEIPWMKDLKYLILKDYGYENIKNVLIKIFTDGYDVIFLDSIENVVKKLVVYADMSAKEAETFMLELFEGANDGINNKNEKGQNIHTAVFAIQQVTKGGEFKGDNALKHETTAMMEIRKDERGGRYITHSKNRRCGQHVDKRLFFTLDKGNSNEVIYDVALFTEAELQVSMMKEEKSRMNEKSQGFLSIFKLNTVEDPKTTEESKVVNSIAAEVIAAPTAEVKS